MTSCDFRSETKHQERKHLCSSEAKERGCQTPEMSSEIHMLVIPCLALLVLTSASGSDAGRERGLFTRIIVAGGSRSGGTNVPRRRRHFDPYVKTRLP